jgi:hypothetical protein
VRTHRGISDPTLPLRFRKALEFIPEEAGFSGQPALKKSGLLMDGVAGQCVLNRVTEIRSTAVSRSLRKMELLMD